MDLLHSKNAVWRARHSWSTLVPRCRHSFGVFLSLSRKWVKIQMVVWNGCNYYITASSYVIWRWSREVYMKTGQRHKVQTSDKIELPHVCCRLFSPCLHSCKSLNKVKCKQSVLISGNTGSMQLQYLVLEEYIK